jgi:hypothetical protein
MRTPNKRIEFAPFGRPTRKRQGRLLAAHSRRWAPQVRLVVPLAVLAFTASGCDSSVELKSTAVVVSVPRGFELESRVYTQNPSLHFRLPLGPDGTGPLYPDLSIEQVDTEFNPPSADAYIAMRRNQYRNQFMFQPTATKVRGRPAVEMAAASDGVFDSIASTGMRGVIVRLVHHEIVFSYKDRYYVCTLTSYPDEYEKYKSSVRSLCSSVRFRENT